MGNPAARPAKQPTAPQSWLISKAPPAADAESGAHNAQMDKYRCMRFMTAASFDVVLENGVVVDRQQAVEIGMAPAIGKIRHRVALAPSAGCHVQLHHV